MDGDPQPSSSWHGAIRQLGLTVLRLLRNRLELFAIELQEEKYRLATLALLCGAVLFCGMMAAITITFTVVTLCPAESHPYVLAGFCLVYAGLACWAWIGLRRQLRDRPPPLAETVNELKKDVEWLRSKG